MAHMGFNKHKNMLKGISNVVEATSKEEHVFKSLDKHQLDYDVDSQSFDLISKLDN